MKLTYADLPEISKLSDKDLTQKLLNSYAARKQIVAEMTNDDEILELQARMDELKSPYKRRKLRIEGVIKTCELVVGMRELAVPKEDIHE